MFRDFSAKPYAKIFRDIFAYFCPPPPQFEKWHRRPCSDKVIRRVHCWQMGRTIACTHIVMWNMVEYFGISPLEKKKKILNDAVWSLRTKKTRY